MPPPRASTPTPQKASTPAATTEKTSAKAVAPAPAKLAPGQKVNINTATKEQLEALPEIGPVKAQAIIDGRPYKTTEDVMKVKGIKEGTFGKIKESITVN
jgi:competence protein ComEA